MKKHDQQPILEEQVRTKIAELYDEVEDILLNPQSYLYEVNTEAVNLYPRFLKIAFTKPANRLANLSTLMDDIDGMMVHSMYPFMHLKEQAIQRVELLNSYVICLVEAVAILHSSKCADGFYMEES